VDIFPFPKIEPKYRCRGQCVWGVGIQPPWVVVDHQLETRLYQGADRWCYRDSVGGGSIFRPHIRIALLPVHVLAALLPIPTEDVDLAEVGDTRLDRH